LNLAVAAHAKLNLNLEVHGRRVDGFHELTTLFQAVSLHDLLIVEPAETTELRGGRADDLVLRAQRALEVAAGRPLAARISLVKRIPAGAGLAGGSSDAAATLRALSTIYGLDVDLRPLAAELGADVPFFLRGGTALGTGKGENLTALPSPSDCYAIAWPGFSVSTAAVFEAWDQVGGEGENQLARAAIAVEPRLGEFAETLEGWQMTGSGTSFFKPYQDRRQAERAVRGLDCWTAVVTPVPAWGPAS
jgi:4-diphosphocytidyl-2-C-methyl-D-erythritol kinase